MASLTVSRACVLNFGSDCIFRDVGETFFFLLRSTMSQTLTVLEFCGCRASAYWPVRRSHLPQSAHKLPNKWLIFRSRVLWQEQEWCQKEFDRNTHMSIYSTNQENEGQLDMLNEADETPEIASRPFPTYGHRVSDIWKISLRKRDNYGWSLVCYLGNWWASSCRRSKEASTSRGKTFYKRWNPRKSSHVSPQSWKW